MEPKALENIQKRSVNTALDEKLTIDEMVRAIKRPKDGKGPKDGKAPSGDGIPAEVWKYGEPICPTDCTTSIEGCQHSHHLQKRRPNIMWKLPRYISSFCGRQDLCSDPTEQTLKPHHPRRNEEIWMP